MSKKITATAIAPERPHAINGEQLARQLFATTDPDQHRARFGSALNLDRIENALKDADRGNMAAITEIQYETINVDPHLAAVLSKRVGAVASLPIDVVPASGRGVDATRAEAFANLVREQFAAIPRFSQALTQLAWGLFHGRSALEVMWQLGPKVTRVTELLWIHPRRLGFGPDHELRLDPGPFGFGLGFGRGIALRDHRWKFIEFLPQLFGEYPEREGLGPRCLYWAFFKRFSMRERMILLELFGKPWRIIEVAENSTADNDDLVDAEEIVRKLGSINSARMPRGTSLHVVSPPRSAGQNHQSIVEEADRQLSKLVLGQTATSEAGGSVPGADGVLRGEQLILLRGDARLLAASLETLADAIVAVNHGEAMLGHAPRVVLRIPADGRAELERLQAALAAGLAISAEEAYGISGFRQPRADEPIVQIVQPPATSETAQPPAPRAMIVTASRGKHSLTLAKQPETANGSPETLIERGIAEGSATTARWSKQYAAAMSGLHDPTQIASALARTHAELETDDLVAALSDRLLHTVMLGILDGASELESDPPDVDATTLAKPKTPFSRMSFAQALRHFESKRVVSKPVFDRLVEQARARAFTIAGAANDAMLDLFRTELARQISQGGDLRGFEKFVSERAESAGWTPANPSHVETIYRTQVVDAYGAGRREHATQPEVLAARPYWQIRTVKDARQRSNHSAVDGYVLAADDPFWTSAYPPFGFSCRCRVTTLSAKQVKDRGLTVRTGADISDLPDKGFSR
jgi:SPP1 gp7 family putative phage head morphogenesis protein